MPATAQGSLDTSQFDAEFTNMPVHSPHARVRLRLLVTVPAANSAAFNSGRLSSQPASSLEGGVRFENFTYVARKSASSASKRSPSTSVGSGPRRCSLRSSSAAFSLSTAHSSPDAVDAMEAMDDVDMGADSDALPLGQKHLAGVSLVQYAQPQLAQVPRPPAVPAVGAGGGAGGAGGGAGAGAGGMVTPPRRGPTLVPAVSPWQHPRDTWAANQPGSTSVAAAAPSYPVAPPPVPSGSYGFNSGVSGGFMAPGSYDMMATGVVDMSPGAGDTTMSVST